MEVVNVEVGANWELSVVVVTLVTSLVVASISVATVAVVAAVVLVGSVPRKRDNSSKGTSVPTVNVLVAIVVGLGLGLGLVVVLVDIEDNVDAVTLAWLLRALTLFADVSASGASVGKSILTREPLSSLFKAPSEAGVGAAEAGDTSSSSSSSAKPSSSKSASKLVEGVVLPLAPPLPRFPARTLFSRPGPATRIT